MRTLTEHVISAGSRPIRWQCSTRVSLRPRHSSGLWVIAFHCCAHRAAVRSVRVRPFPPITIGGGGRCTGLGSHPASGRGTYLPPHGGVASLSRRTITSTPPSKPSQPSRRGGSSIPHAPPPD